MNGWGVTVLSMMLIGVMVVSGAGAADDRAGGAEPRAPKKALSPQKRAKKAPKPEPHSKTQDSRMSDPLPPEPATGSAATELDRDVPAAQGEGAPSTTQGGMPAGAGGEAPAPEPPPTRRMKNGEVAFRVNDFQVEGNTILKPEDLDQVLNKYRGEETTAGDLEQARQALEKIYRDRGYPTVLVSLPEQTVESGTVRYNVVESRLAEVTVTGNEHYSTASILSRLPSFRSGTLLYEPTIVKELDAANTNPDRNVAPVMKPGKEQGTVDVELKVKDRLPMHAKLTGDNRGPFTTPSKRIVAEVQYTNLFDRDHILTVQTSQTPDDWGAVQSYGFSYVAPIQWPDHNLSLYFSLVDSNSVLAAGTLPIAPGDIAIAGNAKMGGIRYSFPIAGDAKSSHLMSLGIDFKRLEKTTAEFPGSLGAAVVLSPIQYTPLSIGYNGFRTDALGITKAFATAKGYVAGMIPGGKKEDFAGDPNDPVNKPGNRVGATGNFAVVQAGLERDHTLPEDFRFLAHVDGQWGSEPLVPTEAYFTGGLDSVRGYVQSESLGDHAFRARLELTTAALPIPFDRLYQPRYKLDLRAAFFWDHASLWLRNAQPGQQDVFVLEGAGAGIRARFADRLNISIDQAIALRDATVTKKHDSFVHFLIELPF
ncbi:MAG: ShlB/FhaC/HecB family hemolysin secretion/activation protein [Nitrospira sp.]|nr:MAG: ShlB/FhaC/HecB family hemolysin secretion/activation protein [Nitrospira sp.]